VRRAGFEGIKSQRPNRTNIYLSKLPADKQRSYSLYSLSQSKFSSAQSQQKSPQEVDFIIVRRAGFERVNPNTQIVSVCYYILYSYLEAKHHSILALVARQVLTMHITQK